MPGMKDGILAWSAVAMVASFLATIAVAMWWTALPAFRARQQKSVSSQ